MFWKGKFIQFFRKHFNKYLYILILIDLTVIFIIVSKGGIDLGISIFGIKLKVTEIDRPIYILLSLLFYLSAKIIYKKWVQVWKTIKFWKEHWNFKKMGVNIDRFNVFLKNTTYIIAAGIIIFGVYLRISHFTSKSMWWDEVLVFIISKRGFIDIIRDLRDEIHQPLFYFIVKIFSFFSRADICRKLPSLISSAITLIIFFDITKKLCGKKVALVSAYLLSISTVHIKYSQMLRMYTTVTLFALLSTYMLYRFLDSKGTKKSIWGYAIFTSLALHTQVVAGFLLMGHILFLIYSSIESLVIKALNRERRYIFFVKLSLLVATCIGFILLIYTSRDFFRQALDQKIPFLRNGVLPFYITLLFLVGAILFSLILLFRKDQLVSLIDTEIFEKIILMYILLIIISPVFIYVLTGAFTTYYVHPGNIPKLWTSVPINNLLNTFHYNLTGQHGNVNINIWKTVVSKEMLFTNLLFPLGVIISFLKGRKWSLLFAIHGISFYMAMVLIGYSTTSVSLEARHFLITLPPIIMFVAIGLIWGCESVFNFIIFLLENCINIVKRILFRLNDGAFYVKYNFKGVSIILRNVLVIIFVVHILTSTWGADMQDIQGWYNEPWWDDWRSFGEFLNDNFKPGILIFFDGVCIVRHVLSYADKKTEDLILHQSNYLQKERTAWQATYHDLQQNEKLEEQGFRPVYSMYPPESFSRIYEKKIKVESPIVISKGIADSWNYKDTFEDYKFVKDAYSIKNMNYTYIDRKLRPTICNKECSIVYHLIVDKHTRLNSFLVRNKLVFGSTVYGKAYGKIELSLDGENFIEIIKIDNSINTREIAIDIIKYLSKVDSFYIKFVFFAGWHPRYHVDAIQAVSTSEISFSALCKKNIGLD